MARFKKYSGRRSANGIPLKGEWVIAAVQADLDAAQEILRDPDQPDSERWLVLQVQKHGTDELKEIAVKATPADSFDSTYPPVGKTYEMVLSKSEFDPDAPDDDATPQTETRDCLWCGTSFEADQPGANWGMWHCGCPGRGDR